MVSDFDSTLLQTQSFTGHPSASTAFGSIFGPLMLGKSLARVQCGRMKVTLVPLRPSEDAEKAGRPSLTPELLAATGARYSRSNEGLETILSKIDPKNLDKSVDSIFRMIDYGHQSIADMVPISMFIDGISILLAYRLWALCPTASGQESSTRYIKLSAEDVVSPEILGIGEEDLVSWKFHIKQSFANYADALSIWESAVDKDPSLIGLPASVLADSSEAGQKKIHRLIRNFGFDRSRYFLPVAAATNVMLIMSARGWVALCQNLLSSSLTEAQLLGAAITEELKLIAPRLVKHATVKSSFANGEKLEFSRNRQLLEKSDFRIPPAGMTFQEPSSFLKVFPPDSPGYAGEIEADLSFHENRYSWVGSTLQRTGVRFGWNAVSFAEIRDLNRHRTGTKYCPLVPKGFYYAREQADRLANAQSEVKGALDILAGNARVFLTKSASLLEQGNPTYLYWTNLGAQFYFEHITTADKFIYEAELRTGVGSHFRYAQHLRDALTHWYDLYPQTKGTIIEGSAEPE